MPANECSSSVKSSSSGPGIGPSKPYRPVMPKTIVTMSDGQVFHLRVDQERFVMLIQGKKLIGVEAVIGVLGEKVWINPAQIVSVRKYA